jgi:LmbE family N-acetylglucosaminyl deacetylase
MAKIMANTRLRDKLREYHASLVYDVVKLAISKPIQVSRSPAIVFAPHHDDETFGCGGLIALKRQLGVRVKLVFLTDGARSHDLVGTVEPGVLTEIRKKEALKAAATLGVDSGDVIFLNIPDQGLGSLSARFKEQTAQWIMKLVKDFQTCEIYVPHRRDRHPDHEATYRIVTEAIRKSALSFDVFQYPVWLVWGSRLGLRLSVSDLSYARFLNISEVHQQKLQAIAAYSSQADTLPHGFLKQSLKKYEIFFCRPIG